MLEFGLHRCQTDHSIFCLHADTNYILLVAYLNDIVIIRNDSGCIAILKQFLQKQLHTKDLGKLRYFLGIEVVRSWTGINLFKRKYELDLLDAMGFLGARLVDVSMNPNQKLMKDEGELFEDAKRYCRLVGKQNYLTITKPSISYVVSVVSSSWKFLGSHIGMLSLVLFVI